MLPPALNGCPKCKKSPNLVTLVVGSYSWQSSQNYIEDIFSCEELKVFLDIESIQVKSIIGYGKLLLTPEEDWGLNPGNHSFYSTTFFAFEKGTRKFKLLILYLQLNSQFLIQTFYANVIQLNSIKLREMLNNI